MRADVDPATMRRSCCSTRPGPRGPGPRAARPRRRGPALRPDRAGAVLEPARGGRAGRRRRTPSTGAWPRASCCSRASAASRTSGRRRRTTSRPTSSSGSSRTASRTWAGLPHGLRDPTAPAARGSRPAARGSPSSGSPLAGRRPPRPATDASSTVLLDAFDVEAGPAAGDRARDRGLARRPAVHPLPRPPRRRAGRGRAARHLRRAQLPLVDRDRSSGRVAAASAGW